MVMEETPSPHVVGREFVRQYYTLLHQAPMHLHRFYNEHSSFVHGGLDSGIQETKPVIGQRQIHHCIQQLDFHDCHAKIQQVDSQATLGNGVVVQVTGELSNNGGPMRRFTQTFVLAQQSPLKYYVHNDIFRYQDEMVNDEEPEYGRAEHEADESTKEQIINQAPNIMNYYNETQPSAPVMQAPIVYPTQGPVPIVEAAVPQPGISVAPVMVPITNYQAEPCEMPPVVQAQPPTITPVPAVAEPEEVSAEVEVIEPKVEEPLPALQQEEVAIVEENKGPKTFASVFKSKGQSGPPPQARTKSPVVQPAEHQQTPKPTSPQSAQGQQGGLPPRQGMNKQGPGNKHGGGNRGGPMRGNDEKRESVGRDREYREQGMDDRRRSLGGTGGGPNRHPDSHQVFVGNIPVDAHEADVKNVFSKYGTVVDLRIINSKNVAGKVFPKYGFVIFSDTNAVHNCLSSKPVLMPTEPPHNLNVEEKRPRLYGDRGPGGDRGGMGGGNRGGRGQRPPYERAER
ncbi:ras GTPase-activating protein-binding protein 2-like [Neocloeon triangulifer]|uniref:ras GTPase-activating protein-binding protein 2-like n=1 Tax=Neocloeon triangulifer TaxID=2078957 RepID=UPI00286EBFA3|nr:ras GTPase-activating protein-binding protein 2-like [Neocloeon triangulifer]XP_059483456.1 ras GTPase-activating protein-binding protein 2-like [Neocloeon triangulifer]